MNFERQAEFENAAKDYIARIESLAQAKRKHEEAEREFRRLTESLIKSQNRLGEFVGRNIDSKCYSSEGRVLTVEYVQDGIVKVKVFGVDGSELR